MNTPGWSLLRLALRPGLLGLVGVSALGLIAFVGQALAFSALLPGPRGLLTVVLGLLPGVVAQALPVAVLLALVAASRAFAERGEWLGLGCAGASPAAALPPVLGVALGLALVTGALTHGLEPLGRREARRALVRAVDELRLQPGRAVHLGGTMFVARGGGEGSPADILLARGPWVATASSFELPGGGALRLREGEAVGLVEEGDPSTASERFAWRLRFAEAELRLDLPPGRVELVERSGQELRELRRRALERGEEHPAAARVLARRTVLPACLPALAALALPLGARSRRTGVAAVAVLLGYWAAMRLGDQLAEPLGVLAAAWLPFLGLVALGLVLWAGWRRP